MRRIDVKKWVNGIGAKILDDTFALTVGVTTPEALARLHSHEESDERIKGAVVGHVHPSGFAFERINDSACRVTYLTCVDPKGNIPHWAVHYTAKQNALGKYARLSKKFGHYNVEAAAEEKDDFTIMLVSAGDKKINVIKEVRAATSLGLKEAKDLVEGAPKEVKTGVPKKEAEEIKSKLEAAGAKVELK